ncbi:MAG: alpha/beta hydrolase [Promethearchaeota archaeon]
MNRNRNNLKSTIFVVTFLFSSFLSLSITNSVIYSLQNGNSENMTDDLTKDMTDELVEDMGFYNGIGQIFNARTDDNIIVKVFRYHAPGEIFNDGAQPVLLFPGLGCNINVFLSYSTPTMKEKFDITLPENLAGWAVGDEKIKDDPLLYYSIAYYLWKMGYDPWFGNYRGIGYGEMRSEGGDGGTSMDHFALYDVKAAVKKVHEITGMHPAIGGHSTGGLTSMMYLHGTTFGADGHVQRYDALTNERNGITEGPETVAGFIGIDPAAIPVLPALMNNVLIWTLLSTDLIVEAGDLMGTLMDIELIDMLYQNMLSLIVDADILGETLTDFMKNTGNLDITNVNEEILYYFFRYGVGRMYYRTLSQYLDFYVHQCIREYWKNGMVDNIPLEPPIPGDMDGYYYYTDNMDKIQVPLICFLADAEGDILDLVDADQIMRDYVNGKTENENDECYSIESAHIDIGLGLRNPECMFPQLGTWLAKI